MQNSHCLLGLVFLSHDLKITRWCGWHGTERKCRFQESSPTTSHPCPSGAPMLFKKRFHNSVPQMAGSRGCPIILQFPGEAKVWRHRLRGFPTLQASCGGGVPAAGRLHDQLVCDRLVYRRLQPPGRLWASQSSRWVDVPAIFPLRWDLTPGHWVGFIWSGQLVIKRYMTQRQMM